MARAGLRGLAAAMTKLTFEHEHPNILIQFQDSPAKSSARKRPPNLIVLFYPSPLTLSFCPLLFARLLELSETTLRYTFWLLHEVIKCLSHCCF